MNPFHLAIPVKDLKVMRSFYKEVLGCTEGRSAEHWVDFNLFGHQLVIHQKSDFKVPNKPLSNPVDGHDVPIPHFGVVLEWDVWTKFANDLKEKKIEFVIEPYIRFKGEIGEQATLFFLDPENNALEFKAFKDINLLFSK